MALKFKILVISGSRDAALNFKRMVPSHSLEAFQFLFLELNEGSTHEHYDGVLVFHKSAVIENYQLRVGEFGITLFYMEPVTSLSYVNSRFIDQFDVTYNVSNFPFKTKAVQVNFNISSYWVGLEVKLVNGNHQWYAKPKYNIDYFNRTHFKPISMMPSIVAPTKIKTSGHELRSLIINRYKNDIDVYGTGYTSLTDKLDILKFCKYHFAIENSSINGYFTEKILDCFLTETYPIYWGAPDIRCFFEPESMILIDHDLDFVDLSEYLNDAAMHLRQEALLESKRRALADYNPFSVYTRNAQSLQVTPRNRFLNPVKKTKFDTIMSKAGRH